MEKQTRFWMPAEWEKHEATWLAWPHNQGTWPGTLERAQAEWVELVRYIAAGETACIVAAGEHLAQARRALKHVANIEFFDIATNDAWIRDYGPTFIFNSDRQLHGINWTYNGWGQKYPPFELDQRVASRIAQMLAIPSVDAELVAEGGALEVNGQGWALTTASCLLNSNRNPSWDAEQLQVFLGRLLGADRVLLLPGDWPRAAADPPPTHLIAGLPGDDTDGHIDQLARFIDPQTLLIADMPSQPDWHRRNRQTLERWATTTGNGSRVFSLPLPPVFPRRGGRTIPTSYLNFYICNRAVLVPQFDDVIADQQALEILAVFADREVIGLPSNYLSIGLGSFHCLTQQQPEAPPANA